MVIVGSLEVVIISLDFKNQKKSIKEKAGRYFWESVWHICLNVVVVGTVETE